MITVNPSAVGTISSAFDFTFSIDTASDMVVADIDGANFYQLNYPKTNTEYTVNVTDNILYSISGGSHIITVHSGEETATVTFTKVYTLPIVSLASNLGDKQSAFPVTFSIKNALSEQPSLSAYIDTTVTPFFATDDASQINSVTVDNETFSELENGAHSIILVVTNDAGSTTKTALFNKITSDSSFSGLKLGYSDDTWDGTVLENRIYEETDVTYAGHTYKSFEDKTPYDTEGEVVTGGLLAAVSRGVQNATPANIVIGLDGTYTETSANGVSVLTKTDTGYVEVFTDKVGNTITKNVTFNSDSVAESTTYTRAD